MCEAQTITSYTQPVFVCSPILLFNCCLYFFMYIYIYIDPTFIMSYSSFPCFSSSFYLFSNNTIIICLRFLFKLWLNTVPPFLFIKNKNKMKIDIYIYISIFMFLFFVLIYILFKHVLFVVSFSSHANLFFRCIVLLYRRFLFIFK